MELQRYSRQMIFKYLGEDGQKKLLDSKVALIGLGALGTVIANNLCRSGVGYLRLIDRDYVEMTNLQRQTLFEEQDAAEQLPKAVAAYHHLSKVNSEIILEPVVADVNGSNIESLIKDAHLVIDGTDNAEIRYLINEACHKHRVPWIYGGALGSVGMTMNILYGDDPCFSCFRPVVPMAGSAPTCSTVGVLNMITGIVASIESVEAVKILIGSPAVRKSLLFIDIWGNRTDYIDILKNPDCPVCVHGKYEFLGKTIGSYTTNLCGRDSIQVIPGLQSSIDFSQLSERLAKIGIVKQNKFMLSYEDEKTIFNLFPDGRAIIKNVKDEMAAKSVYAEYIGL
jgi:molybdopterin/thiamine biosynthesis adenylyltransferase